MAELVTTAEHDMFCPGTSVLPGGRIMVTGGSNNERTSLYANARWERGGAMNIGRGYHSSTVLKDGSVFILGGSYVDIILSENYEAIYGKILGKILYFVRNFVLTDWIFKWLFPGPRKDGEIWDPLSEQWRKLPNVKCEGSIVTNDVDGQYRNDNHMWLFQAPNGKIFHAGPSVMTHWISVAGDGSIVNAVRRGSKDAMNGWYNYWKQQTCVSAW
jgi:galactose oxidase